MRRFGQNLAITAAVVLLAAIGGLAAVGFAGASLFLSLCTFMAPPVAALLTALAILLATLTLALLAAVLNGRRRRFDPDNPLGGLAEAISLGTALGREGRAFTTTNFSNAALVLFGLGLAMGLSPRLRKLVINLLRG